MEMFKQFNEQRRNDFKKETGIEVSPPEELLHDKSAFEKIQTSEIIEIEPGVQLEKGSIFLDSNGSFVNYYDISVYSNNSSISVDLFSVDTPIHLKRVLQNNPDAIAVTNGGFFYLSDEHSKHPKNSNYQTSDFTTMQQATVMMLVMFYLEQFHLYRARFHSLALPLHKLD